jgi:hypothetical protein
MSDLPTFSGRSINSRIAYLTAFEFMRAYAVRIDSDDVYALLSDMSLLPSDGGSVDPATIKEWEDALHLVLEAEQMGGYGSASFRLVAPPSLRELNLPTDQSNAGDLEGRGVREGEARAFSLRRWWRGLW